ncbi:SDR family oxidoreductase [Limnohabitans lacus]|jgi:NAD(P)-dependent dehydrogenase (short-subunit alcohol dehydrogenase family)|uniref:SDR family oxidoreductase n=1 Tax=Limnohabitans lacus TaxID=3045173 RepID=A0ABT6X476_9BURK|nr:SDR family oxidoreductase [Limnohabitans sp. HM2-2]MDI9232926.1 SDR family oxidoreductase [Limnohabitans sp. HM2-2]
MKLVFITGGSSGIGQALALAYLQQGWRVALAARRLDALQAWTAETRAQLNLPPDHMGVFAADVQNTDSIIAAAQQCIAHMGLPDVVIANAGISLGVDTAEREDLEVMRQVMDTNVLGMAATFHPFIQGMQARGSGQLVGIASVAGIRGLPGHAAYCASKAATISYCESLRGELRASGVQVITIAPGYVATPLTARNRYPMPFLMKADDFARQAVKTIAQGTSYRVIPWPMGVVAKLLRLLPNALFDRVLKGQPRKLRHSDH